MLQLGMLTHLVSTHICCQMGQGAAWHPLPTQRVYDILSHYEILPIQPAHNK
jgi:hypothetical protein